MYHRQCAEDQLAKARRAVHVGQYGKALKLTTLALGHVAQIAPHTSHDTEQRGRP